MKIIVIIHLRQLNRLKTIKTTVFVLNYMFFVGQRVDFERRKIVENSRKSERLGTFGNVWELLWTFEWIFWELLGMIGNFWVNIRLKAQRRRETNRYYCYLAVASPWTNNNDSSRPGRYIMPFKLKGTIIPVMNINRYYPILLFWNCHISKKGITPYDVNLKKNRYLITPTRLPCVQNPIAKILLFL